VWGLSSPKEKRPYIELGNKFTLAPKQGPFKGDISYNTRNDGGTWILEFRGKLVRQHCTHLLYEYNLFKNLSF